MLTIEQIRRIAHQTGARDIDKVETDVILTYLLQLFHDKGIRTFGCCGQAAQS
jgi:hypothetical protein